MWGSEMYRALYDIERLNALMSFICASAKK
jgi:hypothetical protein